MCKDAHAHTGRAKNPGTMKHGYSFARTHTHTHRHTDTHTHTHRQTDTHTDTHSGLTQGFLLTASREQSRNRVMGRRGEQVG